MESTELYCYC